ncbi:MAG: phage holin family protein [Roseburia sp.]|nr:phage holin family protein [Roseburia sp.]
MKLEVEYTKFTVAEKLTMLLSALIIGAVCLLLGMVALILLAFALVEVFKLFMPLGLAFLSVAGIVCVLTLILYLVRKPILLNPIARLITKLFFEKH